MGFYGSIGGGGVAQENDPTVPAYLKNIKETDIAKWNSDGIVISQEGYNNLPEEEKDNGTYYVYDGEDEKIKELEKKVNNLSTTANDTSIVLDTWAEYEALSDEEKANGTYYIKEDKKVDVQVIENYSADESVIGAFEGKPLYRKTITLPNGTGTTNEKLYNLSDFGINNVDNIYVTAPSYYTLDMETKKNYHVNFNFHDNNSFQVQVNQTNMIIQIQYSKIINKEIVVTLEYTKTTDETSLSTNPAFLIKETVPMQQKYSTEEHIVGEWIDGKPIYQRTYDLGKISTSNIPFKIDNLEKVIDARCIAESDAWVLNVPYTNISGNQYQVAFWIDKASDNMVFEYGLGRTDSNDFYVTVTLQYTKTTDSVKFVGYKPEYAVIGIQDDSGSNPGETFSASNRLSTSNFTTLPKGKYKIVVKQLEDVCVVLYDINGNYKKWFDTNWSTGSYEFEITEESKVKFVFRYSDNRNINNVIGEISELYKEV